MTPIPPPPAFPAGPLPPTPAPLPADQRAALTDEFERFPRVLLAAVAGLDDRRLDTPYRNWTVRQIVHHLADSHAHAYLRTKLALTEPAPAIKAYDENLWSALPDARSLGVAPSLAMLAGIHERWAAAFRAMAGADLSRTFYHPQRQEHSSLTDVLVYYAWHGRHHAGQIQWLRERHGW